MNSFVYWTLFADVVPEPPGVKVGGFDFHANYAFYVAIGVAVVALIGSGLLLLRLLRPKLKEVDPEAGLAQNLAEYPPPPVAPGKRRLTVKKQPARLRLIVVAPVGRKDAPNASQAAVLADHVLHGLSDVIRADKPRVIVWPSQLSNAGFAPTFFRLVRRPEPEHIDSRWVLVAGPATAKGQKILLGLALWADEPNDLDRIAVEPDQWNEVLDLA
jgi:hypothetical protein